MNHLWDWTIGAITNWACQFLAPSDLVRECLREKHQNGLRSLFTKYWAFPIAMSVAVDGIVLHTFGFDIQLQPSALALYFVYATLKWFLAAVAINWLLRQFGLDSRLDVVVACYTVVVIYAPIYSVIEAPSFYYQLSILAQVNEQHLNLVDSFRYFVGHAKEFKIDDFYAGILLILSNLARTLFLISNVFAVEILTRYLFSDRFKTYFAVWLSSAIFIPSLLLAILKFAVVYPYISR